MNQILCVVSHTHWDREWYSPLEIFRHRLVDLFDRLLVILHENPEYVFHMDAQTIVLEDYLAVRPERKAELQQLIANRRLVVGPWYLQNDFYLTSGEATVRNLLEGEKLCREFGGCGGVGYAADQFGNISQLPQILDDFGIHNFVFGRGFAKYTTNPDGAKGDRLQTPTEFVWQGADGTRCLAIHMRHWYNNAQRFSADLDKATRFAEDIAARYDNEYTLTPYCLLMNGVDHMEAQPDLLPVLEGVQQKLDDGMQILQYNFEDYVQDVQEYIRQHDIQPETVVGEMRDGGDYELLKGTLSSRHYLKIANVRAQTMLENRLEPLFAMMERGGMKGVYPFDHLRYTWKNLMRNHPHDSICGCSRDEVHAHMENRYDEIFEFGNELLRRGMLTANDHMALQREDDGDGYMLTVANTLPEAVTGIVDVTVSFLATDDITNFELLSADGQPVPFAAYHHERTRFDVTSPINLPGKLDVDEYGLYVDVGRVEPFAFKTVSIRKKDGQIALSPVNTGDLSVLENEALKVEIADGQITLTDKASGRVMPNCLRFEECADIGDAYVFVPEWAKAESAATGTVDGQDDVARTRRGDEILYGDGAPYTVETIKNNAFEQSVRVTYTLTFPAEFDFAAHHRSAQTAESTVALTLTLKKDQPWLEVGFEVTNASKDHRLRLLVDTDVASAVSTADIAFDLVTHGAEAHDPKTNSRVLPNATFAALQQDGRGLAVLTEGTHEYEHANERTLAFTLVRSTAGIESNPTKAWSTPGNQCLRTISGRLALLPFAGTVLSADVPERSLEFRAPLLTCATACDTRKFAGGRPCVQDSTLSEFFYLPDVYPQVAIPSNQSMLTVEGATVTAFKRAEDGSGLVLRAVNLSEESRTVTVSAPGSKLWRTTMQEHRRRYLGRDAVTLTLPPKKILTLLIG